MKLIKRINRTLLGLLLLTGSVFTYQLNHTNDTVSASAWSGTQTSTEGNYFSSVGSETGEALKLKLRSIISAGTSESYDWPRYEAADEAENDSSKVLLIYSRQNVAKTAHVSGSVGWNREHSFAKSLFNEQAPAVNDNHHIFADDNQTNSQRGNKPFNELSPSSSTRSIDSYGNLTDNYYTSSYFMPNDLAKGEVARATMYMNTRYGYSITLNFYSVELMLQWHLEHPVTNREVYRNNTVHSLQKNRNPYIDHQDWACKVYSGTNAATQALCNSALEPVEPTSVSVDPTSASINLGSTLTLNASILPSGANQSLTWTSSNQSVATVNQGLVTSVGVGQTTITARSVENTTLFATSTITVTNDPIAVTGITLDKESLSLNPGGTSQVNATISPSNASNKAINWSSNNTSIATVSSTGLVSAVGIGNTVITATTVDGGFVDTVDVIVSEPIAASSIVGLFYNAVDNNGTGVLDASTINNGTTSSVVGFDGTQVVSSVDSNNTYYPRGGGIAIGSSSNPGSLTLSFNPDYQPYRLSFYFNDAGKGNGFTSLTTLDFGVNVTNVQSGSLGTAYSSPSNGVAYIYEFSEPVTTVVFDTSMRTALVEIELFYGVEDTSESDASTWALGFISATNQGCLNSSPSLLSDVWQAEKANYNALSLDAKTLIENTIPDGEGSIIEEALARYVLIVDKYGLEAFITGVSIPQLNRDFNEPSNQNLIAFLMISALATLTFTTYVIKKKT